MCVCVWFFEGQKYFFNALPSPALQTLLLETRAQILIFLCVRGKKEVCIQMQSRNSLCFTDPCCCYGNQSFLNLCANASPANCRWKVCRSQIICCALLPHDLSAVRGRERLLTSLKGAPVIRRGFANQKTQAKNICLVAFSCVLYSSLVVKNS